LRNPANKLTNKLANADENITSLAEAKSCGLLSRLLATRVLYLSA